MSSNLINALYKYYDSPKIDLLINNYTYSIAKLLPHINIFHQFSYKKKIDNRWNQERELIRNIYKKYDLSINLTASDRSVLYALLASNKSISAIENNNIKSWWKKIFLTHYYYFDSRNHILTNNLEPLNFLKINQNNIQNPLIVSDNVISNIKIKLRNIGISKFIIFHPSAQYYYKIYPRYLRDELLKSLNELGIPILVTGSNNQIDTNIKKEIPQASNIYNFIGKTSLEEYFAISQLSSAYIGMDTLNMHIAASQNKRIFAIFGPTNIKMWSPWSNSLQKGAQTNKPIQTYDNITIFQSSIPCELCGVVGCGSNHNKDQFNYNIQPFEIFNEVEKWFSETNR